MEKSPSQHKSPEDVPFALYLNQRFTFDSLASLHGGFARLREVQSTTTDRDSKDVTGKAQLGLSNAFSLLGIGVAGEAGKSTESGRISQASTEIVHTPASLFAWLRSDLRSARMVKEVTGREDLTTLKTGEFVEFEATLRRVPFVELLTAFSQLLPLAELADAPRTASGSGRKRSGSRSRNQVAKATEFSSTMQQQVDLILNAVTGEGSEDLIAELNDIRFVLTTERQFFIDPTLNDTIDGSFRIFGKATRVIRSSDDSIHLLRKSALGKFKTIVHDMAAAMGSLEATGFDVELETEISGPTVQVLPIAIFV